MFLLTPSADVEAPGSEVMYLNQKGTEMKIPEVHTEAVWFQHSLSPALFPLSKDEENLQAEMKEY